MSGGNKNEFIESFDRIRFAQDIRKNPPEPEYMKVGFKEGEWETGDGEKEKGIVISYDKDEKKHIKLTKGIFAIDLATDAEWWFNRSCTVFPLILDQGIRTHVDIKDSFKPEKRGIDFPYLWVAVAVVGILMIASIFMFMFG